MNPTARKGRGLGTRGRPIRVSEVADLSCPAFELLAELRMGDADELAGPLPDAAAAKLGDAILGDHAVHYVLERRDRRAGV
jgi:hypothetical protein